MTQNTLHLYHGSKNRLKGKIQPLSRDLCDFGKGFYMGTETRQPQTLICNYENATMYELELNTTNLIIKDIPLNLDWALFVAFNRGRLTKELSPKLYQKYSEYKRNVDIFKGYIAKLITQSEENRNLGISLANAICRKYRREGRYFDEIISE